MSRSLMLMLLMTASYSWAALAQEDLPLPTEKALPQPEPSAPNLLEQRAVPADFKPSFGDQSTSILFSPSEADKVMKLLDETERTLASGGTLVPIELEGKKEEAAPQKQEPSAVALPNLDFPVFHVSSIIYRSAGDWMLWVNGQRVTAKRKLEGITISHVGPEQVTLEWRPDHWSYRSQVWTGKATLAKELMNIAAQGATVNVQQGSKVLRASMRANQTLVTAGPLVVEGNHPEYALMVQAKAPSTEADGQLAAAEATQEFSGDDVKEMLNKIAKEKEAQRKEAMAKKEEAQQAPKAAPATMLPMPAANPLVRQPPTVPTPQANTLDDILSAVGAAAPVPPAAPMVPLPIPASPAIEQP